MAVLARGGGLLTREGQVAVGADEDLVLSPACGPPGTQTQDHHPRCFV